MSNEAMEKVYKSAVYMRSVATDLHENAVTEMERKAAKYDETAALFREAAGFQDADKQANECIALAKALREKMEVKKRGTSLSRFQKLFSPKKA